MISKETGTETNTLTTIPSFNGSKRLEILSTVNETSDKTTIWRGNTKIR